MPITPTQASLLRAQVGSMMVAVQDEDVKGKADLARLRRLGYVNIYPPVRGATGYGVTDAGRGALLEFDEDQKPKPLLPKICRGAISLMKRFWALVLTIATGVIIALLTEWFNGPTPPTP